VNLRFADQVAVVTGGADGLGKAIATRLRSEGAKVVLLDHDAARLEATARELTALGLPSDVGDEQSVEQAFAEVDARFGRLDVVVNSAGVVGPGSRKITEVSVDDFDAVQRVNLRGSFLVTKYALPLMLRRNYGRILLVASVAGKEGNAGMCSYSASKAGVIGLTKSVGKEFAETGITVNALAPAVIRTSMVASLPEAQVTYMTDRIPMKRCGTLDEVAALAAFIVSPEASFNTGFTFDLSEGRATY
jgi:2-dehydro-3-deoxy-L-rhamnonate dehydrogenase (NAD+)